jgi:TPR repeat protein
VTSEEGGLRVAFFPLWPRCVMLHSMGRFPHRAFGFLLWLCLTSHSFLSYSQTRPDSPVFKDYKTPSPGAIVQQSDATYQLWQGFMVARRANAGDPLAQHELGIRYLTGRGFTADTVKAAYWIGKAAQQKVVAASYNLAILLTNGWGIEWNPFEAYKNVRYSAEQNMPQAQYLLAQFLTDNLVVPQNLPEAVGWLKAAADSGYAPAKELLPRLERRMRSGALRDSHKPIRSAPDSARLPTNPLASQARSLVFLDFSGDSVAQADERLLLREALASGDLEARNVLGSLPQFDDTLRIDSVRLEAVRRSANTGSPEALTVLGRCYEKGIVLKRDVVKGAAAYVHALRLDSPRAGQLLMSLLGDPGFGAELKRRASRGDPDARYTWAGLFALGLDPFLGGEARLTPEAALRLLVESADQGDLPSLVELGVCFYSGVWTVQDRQRAYRIWERAAAFGSGEAQVRLALARLRSSTDSTERAEAVDTLWRAAQEGSIGAEVALAYCREVGLGIPQQKGEAARLYYSAAARGSQDAYLALKRMYDGLRPPSQEFRTFE